MKQKKYFNFLTHKERVIVVESTTYEKAKLEFYRVLFDKPKMKKTFSAWDKFYIISVFETSNINQLSFQFDEAKKEFDKKGYPLPYSPDFIPTAPNQRLFTEKCFTI